MWNGYNENYDLVNLIEVKEKCYSFKDEEDVKNIARHAIITGFNEEALEAQKRLVLYKRGELYRLDGHPQGWLGRIFSYAFSRPYVNTLSVFLEKDNIDECLYIREVLYQKD